MSRWVPLFAVALALVGLVLVIVQRGEIRRIEQQLAASDAAEGPAGESTEGPEVAHGVSPQHDPAVERRVAALEQTVSRLFKMLIAKAQGASREGGAAPATPADLAALREDVDALLTGEALETDQGRKRLHEVIRQAQEEAWQQRRQQWRQWRQQAQRGRLEELGEKARLNAAQVEQIGGMIEGERTQRRALVDQMRRGDKSFEQGRAELRALRQQTDQKVRELVDPAQYQAYEKMRAERRGGPRWLR